MCLGGLSVEHALARRNGAEEQEPIPRRLLDAHPAEEVTAGPVGVVERPPPVATAAGQTGEGEGTVDTAGGAEPRPGRVREREDVVPERGVGAGCMSLQ